MKLNMTPKCKKCGNRYPMDGQEKHTVIQFVTETGKINMCYTCLCKLGAMTEAEKDKFFKEIGVNE